MTHNQIAYEVFLHTNFYRTRKQKIAPLFDSMSACSMSLHANVHCTPVTTTISLHVYTAYHYTVVPTDNYHA